MCSVVEYFHIFDHWETMSGYGRMVYLPYLQFGCGLINRQHSKLDVKPMRLSRWSGILFPGVN